MPRRRRRLALCSAPGGCAHQRPSGSSMAGSRRLQPGQSGAARAGVTGAPCAAPVAQASGQRLDGDRAGQAAGARRHRRPRRRRPRRARGRLHPLGGHPPPRPSRRPSAASAPNHAVHSGTGRHSTSDNNRSRTRRRRGCGRTCSSTRPPPRGPRASSSSRAPAARWARAAQLRRNERARCAARAAPRRGRNAPAQDPVRERGGFR